VTHFWERKTACGTNYKHLQIISVRFLPIFDTKFAFITKTMLIRILLSVYTWKEKASS